MPDETLLVLLEEVRGKTLRFLRATPPELARWAPPGLSNTILWHAGHAYVVVEWLTMQALGRPPQAPRGWFEIFSWQSLPRDVPDDRWPALAEVIGHLEAQAERLARVLGELGPEALDRPSAGNSDRTVRSAIVHGLHDEACHWGEMALLRKIQLAGES